MFKIAIHGFGRIGKLVTRRLFDVGLGENLTLINEQNGSIENLATLLEFDSIHGHWPKDIEISTNTIKINSLALARFFLFSARDVWFVVGIPLFFLEMLSDGSKDENRIVFFVIGSFMAFWTIFYGIVQAWAPSLFKNISNRTLIQRAVNWIFALTFSPLLLAFALWILGPFSNQILISAVIVGLLIFGGVFAINSSLHSFLILYFTSTERASLDVGFYYMSNAAGRLLGTLLSGLSFQLGGFLLCILVSVFLLICACLSTILLSKV